MYQMEMLLVALLAAPAAWATSPDVPVRDVAVPTNKIPAMIDQRWNVAGSMDLKPFCPKPKSASAVDRRVKVDVLDIPTKCPESTVLKIISPTGANCSVVLVGRCTLVTAKHCLHIHEQATLHGNMTLNVPNWTDPKAPNKGEYINQAVEIVDAGKFNFTREIKDGLEAVDQRSEDWAVLHIDDPIGDKLGWQGIGSVDGDSREQDYTTFGFGGLGVDQENDRHAKVKSIYSGDGSPPMALYTDAQVVRGDSGDPLSRVDRDGAWMVGIVESVVTKAKDPKNPYQFPPGSENNKKNLNMAVAAEQFRKAVEKGIRTYPCKGK